MHDFGAEFELSGMRLILPNDLYALPCDHNFPVCNIRLWIELTQGIVAVGGTLQNLSDQVLLEGKIVACYREERQDIVQPHRLWEIEERAIFKESGRKSCVGPEQ